MKRILRGILLALNFSAGVWAALEVVSGNISLGIHLSMMALFSITAIYISPYSKWLWDKPRRIENMALVGLWFLAFAVWVSGTIGVGGATVERFIALIYLAMSFGAVVYLRHLPRVRAWVDK